MNRTKLIWLLVNKGETDNYGLKWACKSGETFWQNSTFCSKYFFRIPNQKYILRHELIKRVSTSLHHNNSKFEPNEASPRVLLVEKDHKMVTVFKCIILNLLTFYTHVLSPSWDFCSSLIENYYSARLRSSGTIWSPDGSTIVAEMSSIFDNWF